MKMTLVVDSSDREGLADALKMIRIMHQKYSGNASAHKESFGKIEFIKLLRKFMKESVNHLNDEESNQIKDIGTWATFATQSDSLTASLRVSDKKA